MGKDSPQVPTLEHSQGLIDFKKFLNSSNNTKDVGKLTNIRVSQKFNKLNQFNSSSIVHSPDYMSSIGFNEKSNTGNTASFIKKNSGHYVIDEKSIMMK